MSLDKPLLTEGHVAAGQKRSFLRKEPLQRSCRRGPDPRTSTQPGPHRAPPTGRDQQRTAKLLRKLRGARLGVPTPRNHADVIHAQAVPELLLGNRHPREQLARQRRAPALLAAQQPVTLVLVHLSELPGNLIDVREQIPREVCG